MRADIYFNRKSIHIKLPKDLHASLREKLFKHSLTMQDLFEDYTEILVTDSARAERIIQRVVTKKIKAIIEGKRDTNSLVMGELDSDTLYNLLEASERKQNDEE